VAMSEAAAVAAMIRAFMVFPRAVEKAAIRTE